MHAMEAMTQAEIKTEKRSAALASVIAACVMTALKFAAGLLTGSLGMLSESAHSGLDLFISPTSRLMMTTPTDMAR